SDKENTYGGDTVTLTVTQEYDYAFAGWTVTNDSNDPEIIDANNRFFMPGYNVIVTAKFTHIKQYETGGDDSDSWVYPKPTANTTPTVTPTPTIKPTEEPTVTPTLNPVEPTAKPTQTQSPMPVIGLLMGLGAAVIALRRK
ncbi:MAG TPA: hypothetical protein O0W90_02570, partial [Methanocorpusculum sp.]|nr:hypothetical protein [Methanocorpusculum sp.]